ncbi:META domain-containing protein [Ovoidimarina sediminis]|uniref:META domain-containing protein n=1 Tax=Ovoidimarina sediminis TaxID=3079856 RepID=UPI00290E7681|nr:META domain-containing protein [Rhodophyticola sp. MJ-SS7]MDU8943911.1 META domain-containing protein [Rhodophyticola sp. MJ-SS7]
MRLGRAIAVALGLTLAACAGDETISGYADRDATYLLSDLFGEPFDATATISFPEEGQIAGTGPCNAYSAAQSAPYPWFEPGPIAATRRACPDLSAEAAFLAALETMTLSEVTGDVLILSDEDGREMVFRRQP